MAAPQGQVRPSRYLATLLAIMVAMYALVFLGGPEGIKNKLHPKLGLDLVGGTTATLVAKGKTPTRDNLERARTIIEQRVNGLGVAEPEVVIEGDKNIVVTLAGQNNANIKDVGQAAELRFRRVLKTTQDFPDGIVAPPSPVPSPAGSPKPGASPSAAPSKGAVASPAPTKAAGGGGQAPGKAAGGGGQAPSPAPSASASPSATPSPSASPKPQEETADQKAVLAKFSPQLTQALQAAQSPTDLASPQVQQLLAPIDKLTPAEIAALPAQWQFMIPKIDCKKLDGRPIGSIRDDKQQVVACDQGGKYLLDKAQVLGTDVSGADSGYSSGGQGGGTPGWRVTIDFNSKGQDKWTNLTREAVKQTDPDQKRVAIVLDNDVISAPTIQGVITGQAEITGSFTQNEVQTLASQLKYGALPISFEPGSASSISPTLGTAQLQAGLLAMGIGMLLVAVYAFFYYRLLGSVIFLSLLLSGILVFGALILLGRSIGFTLTLAGIAGFIVSLGVAADSFVIYFERLKDEIRDGRTPRSAIPRAWARARRTIISANLISIMCATTLYVVAVGAVKGFAFALGLATLLDLMVVFLFRHPMMSLLARSKAFLSPRVSGLGRVLQHDDAPAGAQSRLRSNPKEV
ncbi:MAG: preprotein translocase subunit SecD [Cryptosporangiaceae bacterium]|nr:preprotein translocase subunit SecD [Cryptosporangiaceae bacterium]